jgi:uncharacterized Rossmann fold enzyme
MPELDRFYREASDRAAVLAVAPAGDEAGMRRLVMSGRYSFPIMFDDGAAASAFDVRYVPSLFVIDRDGKIDKRIVGKVDFDRLSKLVDGLAR